MSIETELRELENRVYSLESRVAIHEKEYQIQTKILEKFDNTVQRIYEIAQSMQSLVSIHEEKFKQQDKYGDRLEISIDNLVQKDSENYRELSQKIENVKSEILNEMHKLQNDQNTKDNKTNENINNTKDNVNKFKDFIFRWIYAIAGGAFIIGLLGGKIGIHDALGKLLGF